MKRTLPRERTEYIFQSLPYFLQEGLRILKEELIAVQYQIQERFSLLHDRACIADDRVRDMEIRLSRVECALLDMQEEFGAVSNAVDKDAETIRTHTKRLKRIEAEKLPKR